jgi:chromosome segregation ATPase
MAVSITSSAQSLGQSTSLQLEVQNARGDVARAEQRLRSIERQASDAQREAENANRRAASYRSQAGQARAALGQARTDQGSAELRQQTYTQQSSAANPFDAAVAKPVVNAEGQTLGQLLNTTA